MHPRCHVALRARQSRRCRAGHAWSLARVIVGGPYLDRAACARRKGPLSRQASAAGRFESALRQCRYKLRRRLVAPYANCERRSRHSCLWRGSALLDRRHMLVNAVRLKQSLGVLRFVADRCSWRDRLVQPVRSGKLPRRRRQKATNPELAKCYAPRATQLRTVVPIHVFRLQLRNLVGSPVFAVRPPSATKAEPVT